MEKYAKLMKGLEMCAGPECSIECPYHGETRGGKTCRAWLLTDAQVAIANERGRADASEEKVAQVEAHRDAIESDRADITRERNKLRGDNEELRKECDLLVTRCQVLQNEIDALLRKTDRASVGSDDTRAEYKRGYLDAMEYCFRELCKRVGGGCRHE